VRIVNLEQRIEEVPLSLLEIRAEDGLGVDGRGNWLIGCPPSTRVLAEADQVGQNAIGAGTPEGNWR